MKNPWQLIAILSFLAIASVSCKKTGDEIGNLAPETKIVVDAINLTGDDRLNSVINLSWIGTDKDGYVTGYEISLDQQMWDLTTENDSLFSFELEAGSDSTDIDLYIRAIDNDGNIDPTPAYLRVPLKNSPPVATFVAESFPVDTSLIVTTFEWSATDIDGDESITKAYLKINDGDWFEIDRNQSRISLVPTNPSATGSTDSYLYYGTSTTQQPTTINGLIVGDTNVFYIKVADLANSESEPDTSASIFVKPKTSELLFTSGEGEVSRDIYRGLITKTYGNIDFIDYVVNDGENQPKYWSPTFELLLQQYDIHVLIGNSSIFTNPITSQSDMIIGFAAPYIQDFITNGGKSFIINTFGRSSDVSGITSILPFDSLATSSGTENATIESDSSLVPVYNSGNYPALQAQILTRNLFPFYQTADALVLYDGQITPLNGWTGSTTMAAVRANASDQPFQVFFSAPLNQFGTLAEREDLFNQILNNDFNW